MNATSNQQDRRAEPITDEELMLYVDGELDADRVDIVAAWATSDPVARAKVAALGLSADIVRELVDGDARADGISDAVMASIEADPGKEAIIALGEAGKLVPVAATAMAANDNRRVFTLAGIAAAVAAAFFIWGQTESDTAPTARTQEPAATMELAEPAAPEPTVAAAAAELSLPRRGAKDDGEPGVVLAAVDFGAMTGAVFYTADGDTPVLWVNDPGGSN